MRDASTSRVRWISSHRNIIRPKIRPRLGDLRRDPDGREYVFHSGRWWRCFYG